MSDRLREQIADLTNYYEQITVLTFEPESRQPDESQHTKVSSSPFPGSSRHWAWLTTVRAGTRHAEGDLEVGLAFEHTYRGGSDVHTLASLARLPLLVEAWRGTCPRAASDPADGPVRHGLGCDDAGFTPHVVAAVVERWWTQARELLEVEEAWQRIPEPAGEPVTCSLCGNRSLRWKPNARVMRCFAPECQQQWGPDDLEWLAHETFAGGDAA